jgi:hypothetical protein
MKKYTKIKMIYFLALIEGNAVHDEKQELQLLIKPEPFASKKKLHLN